MRSRLRARFSGRKKAFSRPPRRAHEFNATRQPTLESVGYGSVPSHAGFADEETCEESTLSTSGRSAVAFADKLRSGRINIASAIAPAAGSRKSIVKMRLSG